MANLLWISHSIYYQPYKITLLLVSFQKNLSTILSSIFLEPNKLLQNDSWCTIEN